MADENRQRRSERGGRHNGGEWGRASDESEHQYNRQRRQYYDNSYEDEQYSRRNGGNITSRAAGRQNRGQQNNWGRRPTMQWEQQGAGQRYDNNDLQYRDDGQVDEGYYDQEN